MNKYRKLYNANILGTSDISILKFYYASFKLQQQKGKGSDIDYFLDFCADTASDTSVYAKILGILPFVTTSYSAELKRIAKFIRLRREAVKKLFLKDEITDAEIQNLLYGITATSNTPETLDSLGQESKQSAPDKQNQLELVKEKILKCYSIKGKKQLGDRIFGYLLKSEILHGYTPQEKLSAWYEYMGEDIAPSDTRLHANPKLNRGKDTISLIEHLDTIASFFAEINLQKAFVQVTHDLERLSK